MQNRILPCDLFCAPFRRRIFFILGEESMKKDYYFSTRDLLFIAGFSAVGGIASTYINMIGDLFQSFLGFAGTTQWAAGLHIVWILLAVGIVNKNGTAVLVGVLKGVVELLSGNTHGVLVLIVDLVAGIIVELVFVLPALKNSTKNIVAGGLAAASNVFVFQIFASVPADTLAYWSLVIVGGMAFLSGVVFGGLLSQLALKNLAKTGIITPRIEEKKKTSRWIFLLAGLLLCVVFVFVYLETSRGEGEIVISGNVTETSVFQESQTNILPLTVETSLQGTAGTYTGYPLKDILAFAGMGENTDMVLITAGDGYSYFVTMDEINSNPDLIIVASGEEEDIAYSVVGALNSKAWVRGVSELVVFQSTPLPIELNAESVGEFRSQDWQYEMDSVRFELADGPKKLQGVAVGLVLADLNVDNAATVIFHADDAVYECDLETLQQDDTIRIFLNIEGYEMSYLVGTLQGQVFLENVDLIEVQ